jgi:hypothetical protein
MLFIKYDYLPKSIFTDLQNYCLESQFEIKKAGNKHYSVLETPKEILPYLQADGYKVILSFIRSAYKGFDDILRVHADGIINNQKTDLASVLYINENTITENGTKFYKHHKYGLKLPSDISNIEYDRLILEDSNDASKWSEVDKIQAAPNKLLMYNANLFHAKYPSEIKKGTRIILVSFYKKL